MSGEASYTDGLGVEIGIFFVVLILTALTVASSFLDLGIFNTVIVLTLAFLKTVLVLMFFMHLKESSGFIKLLTFGAFLWVGVMFVMTLNDFASRQFVHQDLEPNTWINRTVHPYSEASVATEHKG